MPELPSGTVTFRGSNGNPISVEFNGAGCNQQYVTVTLSGIQDAYGQTLSSASVVVGLLLGDVNASRRTDSGDVTAVRNKTVSIPDGQTFRLDVNVDARIDSGDVTITRNASVTVLP